MARSLQSQRIFFVGSSNRPYGSDDPSRIGGFLFVIGVGTLLYPQEVANIGASHYHKDSELTDYGRAVQRLCGTIMIGFGVVMAVIAL